MKRTTDFEVTGPWERFVSSDNPPLDLKTETYFAVNEVSDDGPRFYALTDTEEDAEEIATSVKGRRLNLQEEKR